MTAQRVSFLTMAGVCLALTWPAQAAIKAVLVTSGFSRPVFVTSPPGDHERLFVVEQHAGRIRIVKNGSITGTFLTITGLTTGNEQGLLGLAFHPDYPNNRKFYVYYTTSGGGAAGRSVVAEYTASPTIPDIANTSPRIILQFNQPESNHNAGWIAFGPQDGYLYIASGDGGGAGDTGTGHTADTGNAQDITDNLLGKILRVDVNGDDFPADTLRNYAVPPSNPFVNVSGDDEIWAYGLRNPWRPSFDRQTGDLYIADVGQDLWEEVNYAPAPLAAGRNYGWRRKEATHCFNPSSNCTLPGLVDPIYEYGHSSNVGNAFSCGTPLVQPTGCSITGGYVYRGAAIPEMVGRYFFADYCSDVIISFRVVGGAATDCVDHTVELAPGGGLNVLNITSFGEDALGELYICDLVGGELFKIVRNPALPDADGDGLPDSADNCPNAANPDQKNTDLDAEGDVCDADDDNDDTPDATDNCPLISNAGQEDADGDDVGDACDDCPGTLSGLGVDARGCPLPVRGDSDGDFDVDQTDFAGLQKCFTGTVPSIPPACEPMNLDGDTDVDAGDFTLFLECLNGPNQLPPPQCQQ